MLLSKYNLNLLPYLYELLKERNISIVAQKFNTPQPNISRILGTLRAEFNDELLIRDYSSDKMKLTSLAIRLLPLVKKMYNKLDVFTGSSEPFDPFKIKATFNICTTNLVSSLLVPQLNLMLENQAPHVNIHILSSSLIEIKNDIDFTEIDFMLLSKFHRLKNFHSEILHRDELALFIAKDNPGIKNGITADDVLKNFTILMSDQEYRNSLTEYEELYKKYPHISTKEIGYLNIACNLMKNNDYCIILPKQLANKMSLLNELTSFELPFSSSKYKIELLTNDLRSEIPAYAWLKTKIKNFFTKGCF